MLADGGRVLDVTAQGASLAEARERAYAAIDRIDWPEGFCRRDIGWRALGAAAGRSGSVTERLGCAAADIERAARALRAGRLVAFPTETVYGLGGLATSDLAVAAIFAAKGRPRFNPLIVHVA